MESPALVSSSLECGDGCTKSATALPVFNGTESDQCSSPTAYFGAFSESSSGLTAHGISPPETDEPISEKLTVYDAADLLCSLHLNMPKNAQDCTNSVAEINYFEDAEESRCRSLSSGAMAISESIPSQCRDSSKCIDAALTSDESNCDRDECISLSRNGAEADKIGSDTIENGARPSHLPSDVVDPTTKRCCHATADSSSSVKDYTAAGCDIIFSDGIEYRPYGCEQHLHDIMELVSRDLSEPYSIYTYRYFIYNWPNLCFRVCVTNIKQHLSFYLWRLWLYIIVTFELERLAKQTCHLLRVHTHTPV